MDCGKREKIFIVWRVILKEIRIFRFPKICKKHFYHIGYDNIKMVEWTKLA